MSHNFYFNCLSAIVTPVAVAVAVAVDVGADWSSAY